MLNSFAGDLFVCSNLCCSRLGCSTKCLGVLQTGLPSGDVAKKLVSKGRLPSIGTCKDVGVGGFALQGGLGWISRYHGAAADFIQSMDVVVVG